jgi:hypothetical protein
MTVNFKIAVEEWLDSEFGTPEERATLASIGVLAGDTWLTEVEETKIGSVRKTIRVSAYHLAKWLLNNWWRQRWEPDLVGPHKSQTDWHLSHDMPAIGEGYVWPPFSIVSEGDVYTLRSVVQSNGVAPPLRPIRYLNAVRHLSVRASEFEKAIDDFVDVVTSRLDTRGLRDTSLHALRADIRQERRDPKWAEFRIQEGMLGFDPDEMPETIAGLITEFGQAVGIGAVREIAAAALAEDRNANLAEIFDELSEFAKNASVVERSSALRNLSEELRTVQRRYHVKPEFNRPALQGVSIARRLRRVLGLGLKPATNDALSRLLGVSERAFAAFDIAPPPFTIGYRKGHDQFSVALAPRTGHGRRFEFARVLADDLFFEGDDAWRPVTDARTYRQQFQRAFAAEFLCPARAIFEHIGNAPPRETILDEIAHEYDVSSMLVDWQFRNNAFWFAKYASHGTAQ